MYEIEFESAAERALKSLDVNIRGRIIKAIEQLKVNPRPVGCKKLVGEINMWRIRVGDYRIIYEIYDKKLVIIVLDLGHRKDIYR